MYEYRFAVTGTGTFPLDMLRYDACFPARGEDARAIGLGCDACDKDSEAAYEYPRRVVLIRRAKYRDDAKRLTVERWRSFGWDVRWDDEETDRQPRKT